MRDLGHSSIGLIEKIYGHLLNVRHRSANRAMVSRDLFAAPFALSAHSYRNASIGSTFVARRAGRSIASRPVTVRITATIAKMLRSHGSTW